jgi:hypothetical protein
MDFNNLKITCDELLLENSQCLGADDSRALNLTMAQ